MEHDQQLRATSVGADASRLSTGLPTLSFQHEGRPDQTTTESALETALGDIQAEAADVNSTSTFDSDNDCDRSSGAFIHSTLISTPRGPPSIVDGIPPLVDARLHLREGQDPESKPHIEEPTSTLIVRGGLIDTFTIGLAMLTSSLASP